MKISNLIPSLLIIGVLASGCGNDRPQQESLPTESHENSTETAPNTEAANLVYGGAFIENLRSRASLADTRFRLWGDEFTAQLLTVPSDVLPTESMASDGYGSGFKQLGIVSTSNDGESVLLYIDEKGIRDEHGELLLEQVEAKHGYAWRMSQASASNGRPSRSVLVILLLDEAGEAASDEIYVYWDGGTEGGFNVTNLPEDWMER